MIGIYKITNPKGKIYIGQSIDIERRFNEHKRYKKQGYKNKLYNSFKKYNYDNHTFEILEECNVTILNERERYWQEFYNCVENGLNIQYTKTETRSGFLSEYHKQLLRKPKGKTLNKKTNCKILKINFNKKYYILDTQNGIYYNTISEASLYCNFSNQTLIKMLRGFLKNKTNYIIV